MHSTALPVVHYRAGDVIARRTASGRLLAGAVVRLNRRTITVRDPYRGTIHRWPYDEIAGYASHFGDL